MHRLGTEIRFENHKSGIVLTRSIPLCCNIESSGWTRFKEIQGSKHNNFYCSEPVLHTRSNAHARMYKTACKLSHPPPSKRSYDSQKETKQ